MRIVEVEVFGRGGLTHYVYNLARGLGERGHEVIIATAADYELESRISALPPTVRIERVFSRLAWRLRGRVPYRLLRGLKGLEFFTDAFSAAALVRRLRPDLVHVHCTNPIILWMMMLLKPLGVPMVYTAHDVRPHEAIKLEDPIYRKIYGLSRHVIAHSQEDRDRLGREFSVDPARVSIIHHGDYSFFEEGGEMDARTARRELGLGPDEEVALFFGFIREYKGLDLLLDAWPAVLAARPRARLMVAGDPARLEPGRAQELERRAAELGAVHHFRYIPFEAVPLYFGAADALVLPYRKISQSGVLLLALSKGLTVIATRVGAFPEVIRDGDNGILITPGSVPELEASLIRVLGDPELRARLAEGGRRSADQTHSWADIAERTESVFSELVTPGSGTAGTAASSAGENQIAGEER